MIVRYTKFHINLIWVKGSTDQKLLDFYDDFVFETGEFDLINQEWRFRFNEFDSNYYLLKYPRYLELVNEICS